MGSENTTLIEEMRTAYRWVDNRPAEALFKRASAVIEAQAARIAQLADECAEVREWEAEALCMSCSPNERVRTARAKTGPIRDDERTRG